jgi:hypothetical protein
MCAEVVAAIAQASIKLYTAYAEKEKNRREISDFAALVAANSKLLVLAIENVLKRNGDAQVIADCQNRLEALSAFFSEYANNSLDVDKLRQIDQQAMYILAELDDPCISLPAVSLYLSVATLRINALALKAEFEPGDKENAKAQALRSIDYAKQSRSQLEKVPDQRVTVRYKETGGWDSRCDGEWVFICDVQGSVCLDGKRMLTKQVRRESDIYSGSGQPGRPPQEKEELLDSARREILGDLKSKMDELKKA